MSAVANTSTSTRTFRCVRFVAIGIAAAAFLLRPSAVASDQLLTVRATPSISRAPAAIMVRASVEPHEQNRILRVVIESADFYSSSDLSLDGSRAPRTTTFTFRDVPRGRYEVSAELGGLNGRHAIVSQPVRVITSGE